MDGPPDGDLVILLHGFPESSLQWTAHVTALAEAGYRAVAVDQRGYSPGARPPTPARSPSCWCPIPRENGSGVKVK
ncbi:alpha/beta fold hydrolase [Nonomuraea rosea]|uniref:alpha/beta fold hydrolase n=1 Tax=Nonomuraea rosea TaxID=638574 RepID=UPI0031F12EE8